MKQIIQSYKTGKLELIEVPIPTVGENGILVQTTASLISAGTEKMIIDIAKKTLIGKAKSRPDLVKQVLNKVKKEGLINTWKKVKTKLEIPIPLGYSCVGEVLITGKNVMGVSPGDRVACAGAGYANHAEVNFIPKNLFAKVPENLSDEEAAYTTVGCISLQGLRQLNPTLGEKIVVIGSGLIGLITIQLLKANGCDVLAVDIDPVKLDFAEKLGANLTCLSNNLFESSEKFSNGRGVDGVIITASSRSKKIVADAGEICRMRGRVIMIGFMPIEIPRDIYYRKELEFKLSMSYGPGRYDPTYEILGIDYPLGFVRWTVQRNMETFLGLVSQKKLDLSCLTTHRFDFENILEAYKMLTGETHKFYLGMILNYKRELKKETFILLDKSKISVTSDVRIGMIGAGNFAQTTLLPYIKKKNVFLHTLVKSSSSNILTIAKKFGFTKIATDDVEIFSNKEINTVFILTPHNSHAPLVCKALKSNKHVFVEKPLAITEDSLKMVRKNYQHSSNLLMVGFNRRFSKHARKIKEISEKQNTPLIMNYIVNAGKIPLEHWTQSYDLGGGRIIGEICHFIDFMQFVSNSKPISVSAIDVKTSNQNYANKDSLHALILFDNGSIGSITYHALGDNSLPKEYFELSGGGCTIKMYDFKRTEITCDGKTQTVKTKGQDKGFDQEIETFFNSITKRRESPISFDSMYLTSLTTIRILESLQTGLPLKVLS